MKNNCSSPSRGLSRRAFMETSTLAATGILLGSTAFGEAPAIVRNLKKPNSKFSGVQIGIISYSFRSLPHDAESVLKYCIACNISAIELMGNTGEAFAGAPHTLTEARQTSTSNNSALDDKEKERQTSELAAWRATVGMDKFFKLRKMFNDAGITIYAWKPAALGEKNTDIEIDYAFRTAKALGASHVTVELPANSGQSNRLGLVASRYKVGVGYHGHLQQTFTAWDEALAQSKFNGLNCDIGHYVAAGLDPIPLIHAKHSRIYSIHIKDRKSKTNGGDNMPWGEGDTPIIQVLQLMKKHKLQFPATIELEYPIPSDSDAVKEVSLCLDYCRRVLEAI